MSKRKSEKPKIESSWSEIRATSKADEKSLLAKNFVNHDFLVPRDGNPDKDRDRVASILVNQGTTPNAVVNEIMSWLVENWAKFGPFNLTWFSAGGLVPGTLRDYRSRHHNIRSATNVFHFPGMLSAEREVVDGPETVKYIEELQKKLALSYMFLGVNAIDIDTGEVFFHFEEELRVQKACAGLRASEKFVFLDSSKFKPEGYVAYNVNWLLKTTERLTFYVASSSKDKDIHRKYESLVDETFRGESAEWFKDKSMRLQFFGPNAGDTVSYVSTPESRLPKKADGTKNHSIRVI